MIAQRTTNHRPAETGERGYFQAALALLSQRRAVSIPRWICEVCGMVHMGQMPLACDSCGNHTLSQQADIHQEMNNHW